ncbi:hypothetical protein L208DRAFT_1268957, partial [Tricholoma matsutake]
DDERRKIFSWLFATVPTNNYHGALEKRLADTASWIFEEDDFVQWKQGSDSVLRLIGKPGSGKTVLWYVTSTELTRRFHDYKF